MSSNSNELLSTIINAFSRMSERSWFLSDAIIGASNSGISDDATNESKNSRWRGVLEPIHGDSGGIVHNGLGLHGVSGFIFGSLENDGNEICSTSVCGRVFLW
jgi:hypothetical protein